MKIILVDIIDIRFYFQDDGEAGIALVGINSEYNKYSEEYKKDEKNQSNIG